MQILFLESHLPKDNIKLKQMREMKSNGIEALMSDSILKTFSHIEDICSYLSGNIREEKKFSHCKQHNESFNMLNDELVLSISTVEHQQKLFRHRHPGMQVILPKNFSHKQVMKQIDQFLAFMDGYSKFPQIRHVEELIRHFKQIMQGSFPVFDYNKLYSKLQGREPPQQHRIKMNINSKKDIPQTVFKQKSKKNRDVNKFSFKAQQHSCEGQSSQTNRKIREEGLKAPMKQCSGIDDTAFQHTTFYIKVYFKKKVVLYSKVSCQKCPETIFQRSIKLIEDQLPGSQISRIYLKKKESSHYKQLKISELYGQLKNNEEVQILEFWI